MSKASNKDELIHQYKVGDIVIFGENNLVVKECINDWNNEPSCYGCFFYPIREFCSGYTNRIVGECDGGLRSDGQDVIFSLIKK